MMKRMLGSRSQCGFWIFTVGMVCHNAVAARLAQRFSSNLTSQMKKREFQAIPPTSRITARTGIARKTRLVDLAQKIAKETEKLDRFLEKTGSLEPSFDVNSPLNFPVLNDDKIESSRKIILEATDELNTLIKGPTECLRWMALDHINLLSLHAIYHYKIASSFPIFGTATFAQIAEKVNLSELNVMRLLRHSMTNRIFKEVEPGVVAHTAVSRLLAESSSMNDWVGFCVEEVWQAASMTVTALERYPLADDPKQTGFCLANSTNDQESMFTTFAKCPLRGARMGGAMHSLTGGSGYELSHLLSSYNWADLNSRHGTIVDIGGSHGFASIALASVYPQLNFIVQDTPTTIASAPPLSGTLADRVRFQVHNFHTPQPVKGADVYLFRWILHNHSDRFAVPIISNLIPALKRGARVLINDHCLPDPTKNAPVDSSEEKTLRAMDLVMLTLLNSQERDEIGFKKLFERADKRFRFVGANKAEGSRMALIEAIWEGESYCEL